MFAPLSMVPQLGMVLSPAHMFLPMPSIQQKQAKAKGKKPATQHAETHRAGDWVCIICNNLNYSFRKVCNRCQTQTKRDNLLQSLQLLQAPGYPSPSPPPGVGMTASPSVVTDTTMYGLSGRPFSTHTHVHGQEDTQAQLHTNVARLESQQVPTHSGTETIKESGSASRESLKSSLSTDGSRESKSGEKEKEGEHNLDGSGTHLSKEYRERRTAAHPADGKNAFFGATSHCNSDKHPHSQGLYSLFTPCPLVKQQRKEVPGESEKVGTFGGSIPLFDRLELRDSYPAKIIGIPNAVDEDEDEQADYVLKACFKAPVSNPERDLMVANSCKDWELSQEELDLQEASGKKSDSTSRTSAESPSKENESLPASSALLDKAHACTEVLRNLDFVLGLE